VFFLFLKAGGVLAAGDKRKMSKTSSFLKRALSFDRFLKHAVTLDRLIIA